METENNKDLRLTVNFKPSIKVMIEKLQEKLGAGSKTEILRRGVEVLYKENFKDYIEIIKARGSRGTGLSAEDAGKREVDREEVRIRVRKEKIYAKGMAICEALNGKIEGNPGHESCRYKTYVLMNPNYSMQGEMAVPFSLLENEDIEKQYDATGFKDVASLPLEERKARILSVLK